MATSKRATAREWKRKKRQQRMIGRLCAAAAILVVILGIGYIGWDMWSRTFVMTFEGQRIATSDMQFFTLFADGTMDPREQAMEQLTNFLLIEAAAHRNNIVLSDEEQSLAEEQAVEILELFEMFGLARPNVSDQRATEFIAMDFYSEQLMEIYTAGFTVDESAFDAALSEFLTFSRSDFIEMELRVLDAFTQEEAAGFVYEDFEEGFPATLTEIRQNQVISQWDIEYLTTLPVGYISEPIQVDEETFFVFHVDSIEVPTDEEISDIFRESYEMHERWSMFSDVVDEWREATDIQINQRGVNAA